MKFKLFFASLIIGSFVGSASGMSPLESEERLCLALNIYFEARNQSIEGQRAVGYVTLNRVMSHRFPNRICSVVKQRKQFSWFSDGKSDTPEDYRAWEIVKDVAEYVLDNYEKDNTRGALFYHTLDIRPHWYKKMRVSRVIGHHIFYRG